MPHRIPPIARIRLARSLPRLLAAPLLIGAAGAAAIGVGLAVVAGIAGVALAVLGGLLVVGAIGGAAVLLSVRLDVEESAVGVSWLGGERIYPLSPGPVTRVRLRGASASRLRARTGALGWALGPARLRGAEEIEVVRLAATATAILVPTERGRLAIAAANDDRLLDALSRAARARQRLEALAERLPAPREEVEQPDEPEIPAPTEPEERPLTGIERALLEERLAAEREAAAATGTPMPEPAMPAPVPVAVPAPEVRTEKAPRRRLRLRRPAIRPPRPAIAFVILPLVGAAMAWGAGLAGGRMPEAGTDVARLTSLALVLAGPATSVGAVMALAWWPRLVSVVVAGGLAASVLIGRALIGP
jgi:hypothetical protein